MYGVGRFDTDRKRGEGRMYEWLVINGHTVQDALLNVEY